MQQNAPGKNTSSAPHPAPAGRPRRVHDDFMRARAKLAALEAELEALQAAPDFRPRGPTWARFCALTARWAALRPVGEHESFDALEAAAGAAYQAHCADPTDEAKLDAYRRLDDAWAAVLGLPAVDDEVTNAIRNF